MDDSERRDLLGRIRSPSGAIGTELPDRLELQGTTVDLAEFVFECKRLDAVPEARREAIEETKRALRRERLERKRQIEDGEITREEGEELVRAVHGIDRAITALEGIDEPDLGEQLRRKDLEDAAELVSLIEQRP